MIFHLFQTNLLVVTFIALAEVSGHGRLLWPPARSTIFRHQEFSHLNPPNNFDDMSLNCGGYGVLWDVNNGSCGECGDIFADPRPRDNESGGRFDRQIKVANYSANQEIDVQVQLTVNHKGFFEFRLCDHNNPGTPEEQSCLDKYLLEIVDAIGNNGRTREPVLQSIMNYNLKLQLPAEITCLQCILQWHYNTGNSWGDCGNGTWGSGCGNQEWFRGCSDIAIY